MHDALQPDSRLAKISDVSFRPLAVQTTRGSAPGERRNLVARQALTQRVQSEFDEMPGTSLTLPQATRLFGIAPEACHRILGELVAKGLLKRSTDARFRRSSAA